MTRKQLEARLLKALSAHKKAHGLAIDAVNEYLSEHPEGLSHAQQATDHAGLIREGNISDTVGDILHQGAWIADRLAGCVGMPGLDGYERSLSRKIRKAQGYTQ